MNELQSYEKLMNKVCYMLPQLFCIAHGSGHDYECFWVIIHVSMFLLYTVFMSMLLYRIYLWDV